MRAFLYLVIGIVIGLVLGGQPAVAQQAQRLYGTLSTGASIALTATSAGVLRVIGS